MAFDGGMLKELFMSKSKQMNKTKTRPKIFAIANTSNTEARAHFGLTNNFANHILMFW